jgi:hypothetical protein
MMSGFDYRNIDIYEEDSFGPPPRFLVEGLTTERDEDIELFAEGGQDRSPLAILKAVFNTLRW